MIGTLGSKTKFLSARLLTRQTMLLKTKNYKKH